MITKEELSFPQQAKGRKILLSFSFLNGIALTFITGNVLSLYLLKVGCTTPVVAIISSFGYLGTLFALAGKNSIAKFGAGLTLRLAWVLCGLTAITLALIPFLSYFNINKPLIMLLITCVTFLFFVFKSIGTASTQPLMGEFTTQDNRGEFSSKYFLYYTIANIIAMGLVLGLISWHKALIIFQAVILLGGLIKLACSCLFIGLSETEVPRNSARSIITKKLFATIWKEKDYRIFLFCRSFSRAGLILIVPISILALKQLYGVSDQIALVFAFVQMGGGIVITYLNGIISEETGPKPLLLIYVAMLFIISILWIFAPNYFSWWYSFIIFFSGGLCLCGLDSCLNYYYLTIIPRENSVGISLWYTVISGAVAGVAGLFLGGGLIKLISIYAAHNNVFRFYYAIMILLMIPVLVIVYKLKSGSSWRLRDVLRLSIDPHEMHTMYIMHSLKKYASADDELKGVLKLESTDSDIAQDKLIYYLDSPRYKVRLHALRALYNLKLKQETLDAVLKELQIGEYATAYLAAMILTEQKDKRIIPLMRKYLHSKDHHLAGSCMQGLVKLQDTESYPAILKKYKESNNPAILIKGAYALSLIKDPKTLPILLYKYIDLNIKTYNAVSRFKGNANEHREYAQKMYRRRDAVTDEIIITAADICNVGDIFYEFIRMHKNHRITGVQTISEKIIEEHNIEGMPSPRKIFHDFGLGKLKKHELLQFLIESEIPDKNTEISSGIFEFLKNINHNELNNKLLYCIHIILFTSDGNKK